jgi:hypothetical protein
MKHTPSRASLAVVACLAVVLTGVVAVTPAGASLQSQVSAAAQHNWNKIWKQEIRPKADKRYYTKQKAKDRFAAQDDTYTKAEVDARSYTKAESDTKYYSKTETDAKYQVKPATYRGTYFISGTGAGSLVSDSISYGVHLAAAPTAHYIPLGGAVPTGCTGTAAAPNADPGHLCVWETTAVNVNVGRYVTNPAFTPNTATTVGAYLFGSVAGAGNGYYGGTWVMRPGGTAVVATTSQAPSLSGVGSEMP